jgi:hypothetical protein
MLTMSAILRIVIAGVSIAIHAYQTSKGNDQVMEE